jgi:IPT/TIG domain
VTSSPFTLPPPAEGLELTLDCTGLTPPKPTVTGLSSSPGTKTVDVRVTTAGGRSSKSSADEYTYETTSTGKSSPTVTSVSPVVGPTSGWTQLTLTGKRLSSVTQVLIGGVPATAVTVVSSKEITVTLPPSVVPGSESVSVIGSNGQSAVSTADTFEYEDFSSPPVVSKISHNSGPVSGGNKVVVKGKNFTGATQVDFGTTAAPGSVVNSTGTRISVDAPAGNAGTVDITVTRASATSAVTTSDEYTYTASGDPVERMLGAGIRGAKAE